MNEYINRGELLNIINENVAEAHNERCAQLLEAILNAPTADAVEVVRCRDCTHYDRASGTCGHFGYYTHEPDVDEDDYCSYGEKGKKR